MPSKTTPTPALYRRPSQCQAAADAIPILVDDEYHVFHLSTPPNTIRHPPRLRSSWSRLRSSDLVNWQRDEIDALLPGKTRDSSDPDGAWTGSAIIGLDGNMHIFYTGYNLLQGGKQVILHARSNDRKGSRFTKSPSAISISGDMSRFEDIDFRDAHVSWQESENRFWMLVATRLREGPFWTRGCLALLTSPNLEAWTIEPEPLYAPNDMFCPECPEIFSLPNGKWYLVYSRFHAPNAGTVYRIADSPRGPFKTPHLSSGGRFDARRWYAAKSCPKAADPNTRIYFGWVADKLDGQWSWGGDMGVPREITADESGHLIVRPCSEFLNATFSPRCEISLPSTLAIKSVGQTKIEFFSAFGEIPEEYHFEFNIISHDAASFGLLFRTTGNMDGHRLSFMPSTPDLFELVLARYPAPLDDFWADQYNMHLPREVDGPEIARHLLNIRDSILVTVSNDVLEIFIGGKSISHRLSPITRESQIQTISGIDGCGREGGNGSLQNDKLWKDAQPLGVFVEDGYLELANMCLRSRTS
ncbi:hypothetical protein N0V90_000138 [Kalmusia sp. IMI 367209]|nr:hypothetical protein N0V90_000138 [Kalmusia sp. IMI 367209]